MCFLTVWQLHQSTSIVHGEHCSGDCDFGFFNEVQQFYQSIRHLQNFNEQAFLVIYRIFYRFAPINALEFDLPAPKREVNIIEKTPTSGWSEPRQP
jgi:hypothetical protein